MTPVSYSRWQHAQETEQKPKRYNPLYDTPPTARHNPPRPPLRAGGEIRGLVGGANAQSRQKPPPSQLLPYPPQPRFKQQEQQLLSPILTDHEMSPMHQVNKKQRQQQQQQSRRGNDDFSDSNTDYEESDVNSTFERYPSQATQGYADGLADNESEASSMFGTNGNKDPLSHQLPHNKQNKKLHLVSPLEYSAMLKLYNSGGDQAGSGDHSSSSHPQAAISGNQRPHHPQSQGSKDITPDSGVAMGNNTDSNKSNKKETSRQSLISSSSSLNDLLGSSRVLPNNSSSTKESGFRKPSGVGHGKKDYSRVNTRESMVNPRRNNTVFSSSSEESESDAEEMLKNLPQSSFQGGLGKQEKRYHPLVSPPSSESNYPAFRWDGSKVVNSSSNEPSPREGREEGKTRCPPQPMPRTSSSSRRPSAGEDFSESYTEEDGLDDEDEEEEEEVLEVCKEIQNADFNNAQSDSKIVSEQKI